MKTLRILFDATILAEGLHKTSNRSGIFVASFQIFRALDARGDVELGIYSSPSFVDSVNAFLAQEFPERGYRVLNRKHSCFLGPIREFIEAKREIPANKVGLRKRFWQGCGMLAKIARILWDKYVGCRRVGEIADEYDAFFSPVYLTPRAVRKYSKVPRFTVLYDTIPMIYPQFSPFTLLGFSWNFDLIKGLREDDFCFAISECTKRDFLRFSPHLRADHVLVLPLAADEKFHPVSSPAEIQHIRAKYGIPEKMRYVLSLCTIEPRKNLGRALEAFGRFVGKSGVADACFVLAGGKWGRFEGKWAAILDNLGDTRSRIVHAGYVDDEDLAALYSGAEAFVYPSLYEGFGLPPLEAMQCGTPVVTSNVSSLPEVVGDAALMVNPVSVDEIADALSRLMSDASLREDLRQKGLARARQFSWRRTADEVVASLRQSCGENISELTCEIRSRRQMMKKIFWFSLSLAIGLGASGATPLAFWDQSFANGTTQTGGSQTGCSIYLTASTTYEVTDDGKTLQRNSSSTDKNGVSITLAESVSGAVGLTFVVAYSDFQPGDGWSMLGYLDMSSAAVLEDYTMTMRWSSDDYIRSGCTSTALFPTGTATNFYAFSYIPLPNSSGFRGQCLHVNSDGTWQKVLSSSLYSSGTSTMKNIYVGGFGGSSKAGSFVLPTEMKIHGIAVFSGNLSAEELASWEFPSMKKGSVNLAWDEDASGTWTASQFGDDAYTGEGVHKVDFTDSINGSSDPITVTVVGSRSVLDTTFSANSRAFTITGGSITTPTLKKTGLGRATIDSTINLGGGSLSVSAGWLDLPAGFVFSPESVGALTLMSSATLGLRAGTRLSTTNNASLAALASVPEGSLDLGEGAAFDVAITNGLPDYDVNGRISGTGTFTVDVNQNVANSVGAVVRTVFTNFNGEIAIRLHGSTTRDYVGLGSGTCEFIDSWPALSIVADNVAKSSVCLYPDSSKRPVRCSSLTGNASITTQVTGDPGKEIRYLVVGLERDCTYSGAFVLDDNPGRVAYLTVDSREADKTLTLSGDNTSYRSTLAVTNGATVVINETGRWQGHVRVEKDGILELRRAENALGTATLFVNGTLRLVPEEGKMTSLSSASSVTFGDSSQIVVSADLSWCPNKTKRLTLLTAPEIVGVPAFRVPVGWTIEVATESESSQTLSLVRVKRGLVLTVK